MPAAAPTARVVSFNRVYEEQTADGGGGEGGGSDGGGGDGGEGPDNGLIAVVQTRVGHVMLVADASTSW